MLYRVRYARRLHRFKRIVRAHHVCAEQEEILDEIEEALREKHYLAELLPYEMSDDE